MKNTCSKIFFLIGEKKLRLFIIFSISLLISFMEMLSIGLIIPIIAFIFDNNFIIQLKKHIPFLDLNSFTNEYIIFIVSLNFHPLCIDYRKNNMK